MPDLEPITRLEEYLSKLAGSDVPVPEPITRVEKFLAYIAGETNDKPTPITRIEKFLDAIGQGGGGGGGGGLDNVIMPEQTVQTEMGEGVAYGALTAADSYYLPMPLSEIVGASATVTFDGVEYDLTVGVDGGDVYFGDEIPLDTLPFWIGLIVWDNDAYIITPAAGEHTVEVKLPINGGGGSATLITKTITANGTYNASSDDADGYSQVTVNVSGGGGSSYTLLASQDFVVNTVSTSDVDVGTINLGASAWTSDKILYIKVRDKAGQRASHYIGSDIYTFNYYAARGVSSTLSTFMGCMHHTNSSNQMNIVSSSTYGIKVTGLSTSGTLTLKTRYSSSYGTIDGTFNVSVYLLDYAPNQGNPYNYSY